jgi:hypothetical protein
VLVSDFQINGFLDLGFLELTSILGVSWSGDSFDFGVSSTLVGMVQRLHPRLLNEGLIVQ